MDKEKIAKLVLDFASEFSPYDGTQPSMYTAEINMGNFATNLDDVIYLQLEEAADIIAVEGSSTPLNFFQSIRLSLDIPQQDTFECFTGSNTYHLAIMSRDPNKAQTDPYSAATWTADSKQWQTWGLRHKPPRIALRPEVFQQKRWQVSVTLTGLGLMSDEYTIVAPPTLVFSLSK